jgi:hypothetical protein
MEQEMEAFRVSSRVGSSVASSGGSIEDHIDMLPVSAATADRRTHSHGSSSSGGVETSIVSPFSLLEGILS